MNDFRRCLLLSCIPFFILCTLIFVYAVDIPFWDEYSYVDLIDKVYSGTMTFHDLWRQHNEHRIVFPRIITLTNVIFFHWNIYINMAITVMLAFGSALIIYKMINKLYINNLRKYWLFFSVAWLIFSYNQSENWLWGFQLAFGLSVFTAILSIYILSIMPSSSSNIILSSFIAFLSIYSAASGLFICPVGILIIYMGKSNTKIRDITLWSLLVGGASVVYFIDFHFIEQHSNFSHNLGWIFSHPEQFVLAFSILLSRIFSLPSDYLSAGVSVLALCWQIFLLKEYRQLNNDFPRPYIGMLGISVYFLLVLLSITFGRLTFGGFGDSRYIIFSLYFWVSLICQSFYVFEKKGKVHIYLYKSIAIFTVIVSLFSGMKMIPYSTYQNNDRGRFKREVLSGNPIDLGFFCSHIFPDWRVINKFHILKNNNIRNFENVCLELHPDFKRMVNLSYKIINEYSFYLDDWQFNSNQIISIRGWCIINGINNQFNKYILILMNDSDIYYSELNNEDRGDLIYAFPNEINVFHCGFSMNYKALIDSIPPGKYDLCLGVENSNGKFMCSLNKQVQVQ